MDESSAELDSSTLLTALVEASKKPAKSRPDNLKNIKPTVEQFTALAYDRGILPESLADLIDLLTVRNHLDQASLGALIRNLYPVAKVSSDLVLKVVGSLGHGQLKPSLGIQAQLLKWLIMVYHVIDKPLVLSQSYSVLFNLLDTAAIRQQLCQLLALVTRRKHVKLYRIQALVELSRHTAGEAPVSGLLRVFKEYYPEIIARLDGKPSVFKHPNPEWRSHLEEIQASHLRNQESASNGPCNGYRVFRSVKLRTALPQAMTTRVSEDAYTLEEVANARDLVKNVEKIPLPSQLIAVLADPLLQKFMLLRSDARLDIQYRASSWIKAFGQDVLDGEADSSQVAGVMWFMKAYVSSVKLVPPVFLLFLSNYFNKVWDGRSHRDEILGILGHIPMHHFKDYDELRDNILGPLERCIFSNEDGVISSHCDLIQLYVSIIRQWKLDIQVDAPDHSPRAFQSLAAHVNTLSLSLLNHTQATDLQTVSLKAKSTILDFYTSFSSIVSDPDLQLHARIVIPPEPLVYNLFFTPSLAIVSRTCIVLTAYKIAFERAMALTHSSSQNNPQATPASQVSTESQRRPQTYDSAYVNTFNGYLMDGCNCLWRSRAFNSSDLNARGCLLSRSHFDELSGYLGALSSDVGINAVFGLSHHPLTALLAIGVLREKEDQAIDADEGIEAPDGNVLLSQRHAGPVTQASLGRLSMDGGLRLSWGDYRLAVLRALEERGVGGISRMMYNTMKNLMRGSRASQG